LHSSALILKNKVFTSLQYSLRAEMRLIGGFLLIFNTNISDHYEDFFLTTLAVLVKSLNSKD